MVSSAKTHFNTLKQKIQVDELLIFYYKAKSTAGTPPCGANNILYVCAIYLP